MQLSSSTSCSSRLLGGVREYTVEKKLWWMVRACVRACIVGVGVTRRWTDNVPWGFLYHQRADYLRAAPADHSTTDADVLVACAFALPPDICPPRHPPDLGQSSWASALAVRLQRTVSMWPKQRTSLIWPASEKLASQERIWLNWTKPDIVTAIVCLCYYMCGKLTQRVTR